MARGGIEALIQGFSILHSIQPRQILRTKDCFNAENLPAAKFTSDKFIFNNQAIASISGELAINIEVSNFACGRNFITLKYMCGANATAKLSRSEFDLGKYVPFVGDEINLNIIIVASKE